LNEFLATLAVFVGAHDIPAAPAVRRRLIRSLGEAGFLAGYSLLSLVLFALLLRATLAAPYLPVWPPARWTWLFPLVGVPLALVLLCAGAVAPNSLSIAFVPGGHDPARPGAVALTRHPILWGLGLWGLAHVPPNGHVVGLVLFGGLGGFALLGLAMVERRRRRALGDRWATLAAGTSFLPFMALLAGRARWPRDGRTLAGMLAGLGLAGLLLGGLHAWLFGRDPLAFL
jgi:uncharacterized membrane protein